VVSEQQSPWQNKHGDAESSSRKSYPKERQDNIERALGVANMKHDGGD